MENEQEILSEDIIAEIIDEEGKVLEEVPLDELEFEEPKEDYKETIKIQGDKIIELTEHVMQLSEENRQLIQTIENQELYFNKILARMAIRLLGD